MTRMLAQLVPSGVADNAVAVAAVSLASAAALLVVARISWKAVRRQVRHHRVRRELRLVHEAAYKERPQRGSYVA